MAGFANGAGNARLRHVNSLGVYIVTYERHLFHSDDKFLGTEYNASFPTKMKYLPRVGDKVVFILPVEK